MARSVAAARRRPFGRAECSVDGWIFKQTAGGACRVLYRGLSRSMYRSGLEATMRETAEGKREVHWTERIDDSWRDSLPLIRRFRR